MNKTALITGASGSLGKEVVARFVNDGYKVAAIVSPRKKSSPEFGPSVAIYEADLRQEENSSNVVDRVISEHSGIDAALLLAGGFAPGKIKATNLESIHKMFAINFETAYNIARPVFDHMLGKKSGRIVLVGARPALNAEYGKDLIAYALSKSLLFKLAELMNAEGASSNVVTSVIVPSTIDTGPNREAMPKQDFSKWVTPAEIAAEIAFLCSSESKSLREPILKLYGNS